MGTRSTLQINSKSTETTTIIYKHWDGYPSDNLRMILEAFKAADNDPDKFLEDCSRYYTGEPMKGYEKYHKIRTVEDMLEYCGPYSEDLPSSDDYWQHGDLEFHYVVDLDNRTVKVFGGFGSESDLREHNNTDVFQEVLSYADEYQAEKRKKLMAILTELSESQIKILA